MLDRVTAALAGDFRSQAAYAGRVTQTTPVDIILEDGTYIQQDVEIVISWETIKKLLTIIREQAGIPNG